MKKFALAASLLVAVVCGCQPTRNSSYQKPKRSPAHHSIATHVRRNLRFSASHATPSTSLSVSPSYSPGIERYYWTTPVAKDHAI